MTAPKVDASPKSPAESLIAELEARVSHAVNPSMQTLGRNQAFVEAIAIIRQHQSEQPQEVVERVARYLCKVYNPRQEFDGVYIDSHWRYYVSNAIAAMGDGRAAIAPVSAETVPSITPAIPENLQNMMLAHLDGIYRFSARDDCDRLLTEIFELIMGDAKASVPLVGTQGSTGMNADEPMPSPRMVSPAIQAYGTVKEALEVANATGLYYHECAETERVELCRKGEAKINDALAVLPTLMPVAPREISAVHEKEVVEAVLTAISDFEEGTNIPPNTFMDLEQLILRAIHPYLRQTPVDIEAGAIACSQWVYGVNHGAPSWDRLSEEHRNEYREQAKACAKAWGMTYVG